MCNVQRREHRSSGLMTFSVRTAEDIRSRQLVGKAQKTKREVRESSIGPINFSLPRIYSHTGDETRGNSGSLVLSMVR